MITFSLLFGIFFCIYLNQYADAMRLYYFMPRGFEGAKYIGRGRLMEEESKGRLIVYKPTAACIYPFCNKGKILIADAPPKEVQRLGKSYVGICSIAGKDHSYYLDSILVATPERFDWQKP